MKRFLLSIPFSILINFALLFYTTISQINNNIQKPIITVGQFYQNQKIIEPYQNIFINEIPLSYSVGTIILQRQKPQGQSQIQMNQLFHKYSEQFETSNNCLYNDPQLQLNLKDKKRITYQDSYIKEYFINQALKIVYILTDKQIQIYSLNDNIINLIGTTKIPVKFQDNQMIYFFQIDNEVCITNGIYIYLISIREEIDIDSSIAAVYWNTLSYSQQIDLTKIMFKKCFYNNGHLFVLMDTFYAIFRIKIKQKYIKQIQVLKKQIELSKYLTSDGTFVDAFWNPSKVDIIFLLTDINGIIQIKHNSNKSYQIQHHNIGELGICLKFEKFNNIFQIIFKTSQKGQSYVAQFQYKQQTVDSNNNNTKSSLVLNRFYNKISPVKDIQYFYGNIFILGQYEFQIYGPAVNRYLYESKKFQESPYSGYNYDLNWLQVIQSQATLHKLDILGLGDQQIILWEAYKKAGNVSCQISKNTDIWLKFYGSNYKVLYEPALIRQAVQYNYLYHFRIKDQFSISSALLITRIIILILILIAMLNCYVGIWKLDDIIKKIRRGQQKLNAFRKRKYNLNETLQTLQNNQKVSQDKSQINNIMPKQSVQMKIIQEIKQNT